MKHLEECCFENNLIHIFVQMIWNVPFAISKSFSVIQHFSASFQQNCNYSLTRFKAGISYYGHLIWISKSKKDVFLFTGQWEVIIHGWAIFFYFSSEMYISSKYWDGVLDVFFLENDGEESIMLWTLTSFFFNFLIGFCFTPNLNPHATPFPCLPLCFSW